MQKHFYRNATYVTTIDALQTSCIFKSDAFALAYKNNEETHALACDLHNSPINITTEQVDLNAFDAYGHSSLNAFLPVAFNGERFDAFNSHYPLGNGYRSYLPNLRRFNSPDDLSPFSKGGINYYAYASGDPVNFIDPTGRWRASKPLIKPLTEFNGPVHLLGKKVNDQRTGRAILVAYAPDGTTVIQGHGNPYKGTIGGYTPKQVRDLMIEANLKLPDGPITLANCMGSRQNRDDPFVKPTAQTVANTFGQPVTSFKNNVWATSNITGKTVDWKLHADYNDPKPKTFYPKPSTFKRIMSLLRSEKR